MTRTRRALVILACWTVAGLFFAAQVSVVDRVEIGRARVAEALRIYLTCAYIWAALTPLVLRLARRYPLARPRLVRNVAVHIAASVACSLFTLTLLEASRRGYNGTLFLQPSFARTLRSLIVFELHADILRYWAVVGIAHAIGYYTRLRERERAESAIRAELAEARLEVLKRQLHPHFLFNTLNSISVLMFEDVAVANRMLIRLSDLLRNALATNSPHEVPLGRELDFLQQYLEIEKMRFGERLTVDVDVDASVLGARVPNLILQPIVENAIRHGVAAVDRASTVSIRATRDGGDLLLEVRDDGPGMRAGATPGIGIHNTEARLRQLYGSAQRMELANAEGGGVEVRIAIPYRPAVA